MITFLSEEAKRYVPRYGKRDFLIYLLIFIAGVLLLGYEIYYLISSYPEPFKLHHLPLLLLGIILFNFSPSHFICERLFPGSTVGTFGVYRIIHVKSGEKYYYPDGGHSDPFKKDAYAVEYASPRQFYGYRGKWWEKIGIFFSSEKSAKEFIDNHKKTS